MNLSSQIGLKDLIKIETRYLSEKEIQDIAVFAPQATISFIKNYKVEKKMSASLPLIVEKILVCPNNRCITNTENVSSNFFVEEFKNKIKLRCKYCERTFFREEIKSYNV